MLADPKGKVIHNANNLLGGEMPTLGPLIERTLARAQGNRTTVRDGVSYPAATLKRNQEGRAGRQRDRFASMACGPDGRVYLVFTRRVSNNSDVLLRVFDGTKWSKDRPVAATPADEYDGSVVVGKEGELWLAWTSNARGKKYNIFVARADRPSAPIQPTPLTQADDDAMHARLACDRDGRVWATYYKWHKRRGCSRDREVYVRRNDGKNWSREIQVSPQDVPWYEDHSDPAIAPYADGVVVCWSWDYHRPKGYPDYAQDPTIFARTIGDDLNLGNPVVVSRRYIDTAPAVAVDPVGRVWCAWDSMWRSRSARGRRGKP